MAQWILHIVGETLDDDLAEPISKFVKEIETLSHRVHQVRITSDAGEKIIHVEHEVGDVVDTIDPAADADVAAVESKVDPIIESHEETPAPAPPVAPPVETPPADTTPPVESSTPVVDTPPADPTPPAPVDVPPVDAPVDPPVAGASSTDSNTESTTSSTTTTTTDTPPPVAIPAT